MGKLSDFSIDFVQESTISNLLTRSVSISSSISLYLANARLPSLCPDNLPIIQFYKSLYITTIPTFSHIISDVQSAKFNKNSDEYHARTYIYSDEKRKTAHHNLTINPSSILSGRHILHLPYDMHIVQRLKS